MYTLNKIPMMNALQGTVGIVYWCIKLQSDTRCPINMENLYEIYL